MTLLFLGSVIQERNHSNLPFRQICTNNFHTLRCGDSRKVNTKTPLSLEQLKDRERKVEKQPRAVQYTAGELGSPRRGVPRRSSVGLVWS